MSLELIGMIATLDQSETRASAGGPLVDREYVRRFARAHEDGGFDKVLVGYSSGSPDGLQVAAYAVALVRATRTTGAVRLGASPRAAISLLRSAQAHAVLCGRPYVTPGDVQAVAVACLSHRLIAEGTAGEGPVLVGRVIADTPAPTT